MKGGTQIVADLAVRVRRVTSGVVALETCLPIRYIRYRSVPLVKWCARVRREKTTLYTGCIPQVDPWRIRLYWHRLNTGMWVLEPPPVRGGLRWGPTPRHAPGWYPWYLVAPVGCLDVAPESC